MEQHRKPSSKSIHLWSINLCKRKQEYTVEKKVSSISGSGETGQLYGKGLN